MKTKTRIRYRIDTHWNGVIKAYLLVEHKFTYFGAWKEVHREKIYEGTLEREAHDAIDKRVAYEKGDAIKWSSYKDDRGVIPVEDYAM